MEKKFYETPAIEVVEIESEGVLCASGVFNPYDDELNW